MIKFSLNGHEITCENGDTVLEAANKAGIEIQNLCYNDKLKIYGACGLCLVESDKSPKLMRACSAKATDGAVYNTNSPRAYSARKTALELIMSDHEGDCKGPCKLNCPAGTEVQEYLNQISLGNYKKAVEIIKDKICIPASIGRVCPHPCEKNCRRALVEEPISIAFLKAFAADKDLASDDTFMPEVKTKTGKKVAVIGGGPAGLQCAFKSAVMGHSVTVFDAMPEMGGMLRYGIPEYRLPKKVLGSEIDLLKALGVDLKNEIKIGTDISLDEIRKEYDAVLIAVGAWKSSPLRCKGEELNGVYGGIDFLRDINCGKLPNIGKNVAVVGGGNTAMDACRSAVRCGAENVYVIYRRTRNEAPAEDGEITEAIEEGVDFRFLTNPDEIIGENGKVKAIKLQIMELGEPDESGRRKPIPIEGKFETLEVDSVIAAIGQKLSGEGLEEVTMTDRGTVSADELSCKTNLEGVFAAGDATNKGASIAIEAINEGNKAAYAIDAYLNGREIEPTPSYYSKREVSAEDFKDREKLPREKMSVKPAEIRKKNFDEIIDGFNEAQAKREAARCLECGCFDYYECKLIRYAQEMNVEPDKFKGSVHESFKEKKLPGIERDQGKCILCNLCVRTCNEEVHKGILGLVGRGFKTVIKPEFDNSDYISDCINCLKCAKICPTGALKITE